MIFWRELQQELHYEMTQGRPSLGVRVCSGARERVRAQGTSLSSTTLNPGAASRLGTHSVPALPGTAFQPLIYHPITCLFCCICRPFTAAIYQERSQRQKREWWPSASPSPDVLWFSFLNGGRGPVGGWSTVNLSKMHSTQWTVVVYKSYWTVFSNQACLKNKKKKDENPGCVGHFWSSPFRKWNIFTHQVNYYNVFFFSS